jgi:hypothetical protein
MKRLFLAGVLAAVLPLTAFAAAVAQSVRGEVQANGAALAQGQKVSAPVAISTGPGAQVFLRFDDQMEIVLGENSLLRIVDFRYTSSGVTDRAVFELLRGSARVVTGKIAESDPRQFYFRTPQTQLTMDSRGADFTVALVNPAYIRVNAGSVISSNGWGNVPLSSGSTSAIASNAAAPQAISASALPATASLSMQTLAAASVSGPAGGVAAGAGTVAGGTAFGIATPVVVVGAIVAGVAAAAAKENDAGPSQPSTTTHH